MQVELLYYTPKWVIVEGIRTCWKTNEKSDSDKENDVIGFKDRNLIKKIIQHGHTSTLEHSLFTYRLKGISRALLQELSRHRVGVSPSVESSRYTFNRILRNESNIEQLLVSSGDEELDNLNIEHMERVKELSNRKGLHNDVSKYGLVESYKVTEVVSFNMRSLRHFYILRNSSKALLEIRKLSQELIYQLPMGYEIFFEDLYQE